MRIPTLLPPTPTLRTANLSRLTLSLPLMMPPTKHPQVLRPIIIMVRITNLMVNLIPIPATQANIPVIILDRPLAPMPIPLKNHRTHTRPIRIKPFITTGTRPHHSDLQKTGLAGAEQESKPKGKQPKQEKFSDQPTQVLQEGIEPSRHKTTHFEYAASTIPPPKQKKTGNPHATLTTKHGDCLSSNPNRHKEIQWQKMAFYRQPRRADAEGVEPPNRSRSPP